MNNLKFACLSFLIVFLSTLLGHSQVPLKVDVNKYGQLNLKIAHLSFAGNSVEQVGSYKLTKLLNHAPRFEPGKIELNYTGRALLKDSVLYKRDPEGGWMESSAFRFSYDANSNITTRVHVSDGDTLEWAEYEYNRDGRLVQRIIHYGFDDAVSVRFYNYKNGKLVKIQHGTYSADSSKYVPGSLIREFRYENGNLNTIIEGDSASLKFEVSYYADGKLASYAKYWKADSRYRKSVKDSLTYNADGQIHKLINYGADSSNSWYKAARLTFEYGAEGKIIQALREKTRQDSIGWRKNSRWLYTYDDRALKVSRVKQFYSDKQDEWGNDLRKEFFYKTEETLTATKERSDGIPDGYRLEQNYPNPFNPKTTITYALDKKGEVSLKIYNLVGKKVAELVNSKKEAGKHKVQFNASNLSSGVYIYKLITPKQTVTKKMTVLK